MKKVYILTTYTGTILSTLIKKITDVPYAHVSISLDNKLDNLYSFGRKYTNNPVIAGFIKEGIDEGLYKKKENTLCRVCSIEISNEEYVKLIEIIDGFVKNKNKYKYDIFALLRLLRESPKENEYKYVCSQFVAYVLEKAGVKVFNKSYLYITPLDFYNSSKLKIEYEGLLSEYKKEERFMLKENAI